MSSDERLPFKLSGFCRPDNSSEWGQDPVSKSVPKLDVTGLEWSQVDLHRRIAWAHPDQAKARKAIGKPLNAEAMLVLRRQMGKHPRFVSTHRGNPIRSVSTMAWKAALNRADIADFRWHDLRHSWASWHVQAGTPSHVLQELGGWELAEMARKGVKGVLSY